MRLIIRISGTRLDIDIDIDCEFEFESVACKPKRDEE